MGPLQSAYRRLARTDHRSGAGDAGRRHTADDSDFPAEVTMTFEQGVPKTLNGKEMKVSEIITELNKLGGENGIGIVDIVENRVVGMKSRGVYETPGGTILMAAHEQLEELTLDRETMETKKKLGSQFAQVVYELKTVYTTSRGNPGIR